MKRMSLAWIGIVITAAIAAAIFFARRRGASGLDFGGALGEGSGGALGEGSGGAPIPVAVVSPATSVGPSDAGAPAAGSSNYYAAGQSTTSGGSPIVTVSSAIAFSPSVTYGGLQRYEAATGRTVVVRDRQGYGVPGVAPGVVVPLSAAFGFGGDAINSNGTRNANYRAERRAGLRNEAVSANFEQAAGSRAQPTPAPKPSGVERRAARLDERFAKGN